MNIYDEVTNAKIEDPDLTTGYVYSGVVISGYTEETIDVVDGTVTEYRPDGLQLLTPSKPILELCLLYHKYTEDELAEQKKLQEPSQLDRVEAQAVYTAMMTGTLMEE